MNRYHIEIYFNETHTFRRYEDNDKLRRGQCILDLLTEKSPLDACEQAYRYFNDDERPNRFTERSLSVGDVVKVVDLGDRFDHDTHAYWFTCDSFAWVSIIAPLQDALLSPDAAPPAQDEEN